MNKKNTLLGLLMISILFATAQTSYEFTKSTKTYTDLVSPTNLNGTDVWDDPEYKIKMPFAFNLFDTPIGDSLYFTNLFGGGEFGTKDDTVSGTMDIVAYGTDLVDRGDVTGITASPISYLVDGTTPNRILKIEFKNAGFLEESDSMNSTNDFVNFQVWLYETTQIIEMHYGASKITDANLNFGGETGPTVNISDTLFGYAGLFGDATNPTVTDEDTAFITIVGTPTNGTVYTFKKKASSLNKVSAFKGKIYPNPVLDNLNIQLDNWSTIKSIKIININGQTVYNNYTLKPITRINTKVLNTGVYSIIISNNDGTMSVKKLIKL